MSISTKNHKWLAVVVAVSLIVTFTLLLLPAQKVPDYSGRDLHEWLNSIGKPGPGTGDGLLMNDTAAYLQRTYPRAGEAFVAMAPESFELLVEDLKRVDSDFTKVITKATQPLARFGWTNTPPSVRGRRAALALAMSGEGVTNIFPEIIPLISDPVLGFRVAWVVSAGGSGAIEPCRQLLRVETNAGIVNSCSWVLAQIGTNASFAVGDVLPHLKHPDGLTRSIVAWSLARISEDPAIVVPALLPLLQDSNRFARNGACGSLAKLGAAASNAVPALVDSIANVTEDEREFQLKILESIDPSAALRIRQAPKKVQ